MESRCRDRWCVASSRLMRQTCPRPVFSLPSPFGRIICRRPLICESILSSHLMRNQRNEEGEGMGDPVRNLIDFPRRGLKRQLSSRRIRESGAEGLRGQGGILASNYDRLNAPWQGRGTQVLLITIVNRQEGARGSRLRKRKGASAVPRFGGCTTAPSSLLTPADAKVTSGNRCPRVSRS